MKAVAAVLGVLVAAGLAFFLTTSKAPSAEMTVDLEANKQVVRDCFAAIDAGNLDRVQELLAPDLALSALGSTEEWDTADLMQLIQTFYAAFPDNTHVIENLVAEGDFVAVTLIQYATHEADYEGVPATGNSVTVPAMHLIQVSGGAIRNWWAVEDNLGLMLQIGMQLTPVEEG